MSEELNNQVLKHQVTLTNRKELFIEGVKSIQSFDSSEFLIEDNVSEIKCRNKECGNKFTMIWDNATDSYVGQVFEY